MTGDLESAADLDALEHACGWVDRSAHGRLLAAGPDLPGLVHRLGTSSVADLAEGAGRFSVLTTNKGRIVDRIALFRFGSPGTLVVTGPGQSAPVRDHLAKYTFAEDLRLEDRTDETSAVAIVGPQSERALTEAGLPVPGPLGIVACAGTARPAFVLGFDCVEVAGFTLVAHADDASILDHLRRAVEAVGGRPVGFEAIEARRIERMAPIAPNELDDEANPLEAGLIDDVDFRKGCYVGQEVIARLNTYDKVSRRLVRLRFAGPDLGAGQGIPAGSRLTDGGRIVGRITSIGRRNDRSLVALGYVKKRFAEPDARLSVAELPGDVVAVVERVAGADPG